MGFKRIKYNTEGLSSRLTAAVLGFSQHLYSEFWVNVKSEELHTMKCMTLSIQKFKVGTRVAIGLSVSELMFGNPAQPHLRRMSNIIEVHNDGVIVTIASNQEEKIPIYWLCWLNFQIKR